MSEKIVVGMGEIKIAGYPDTLAVYGVGSCVIVLMYDKKTKIGGIAHTMLPDSTGLDKSKINLGKFSDTAIPLLFEKLSERNVYKSSLWAKIVGGSVMFPPTEDLENNIGRDNAAAARNALKKLGIPIIAEDIGGNRGRTIEFDLDTGIAKISVIGEEKREL